MAGTLLPAACWAACWIAAAMAALAAAVAAHEWAHMLVAWCFGLEASMQAGPTAILRVLDPRPPSSPAGWARLPHVRVSAAGSSRATAAALRHAGWVASAAVCASAAAAHGAWAATAPPPLQAALHAAMCVAGLVLVCSLPTDLCGVIGGCGCSAGLPTFFCGNLGLLLASATAAAQAGIDPLEVLERQTAISMMRGAQSGGLVTLVTKGGHGACSGGGRVEGVRCRVAPSKRQSLAVLLGRQFRRAAGGCRHPGDHGIFVGHTRFATSSIPLPSESHPHQWSPTAPAVVWRADGRGGVAAATEQLGIWITHNGDYDFSRDAAGRYRTHHELSEYLSAVLTRPANAKCDSINLAGMLELHRCQGCWAAALRLALIEVSGVPFERIVAAGKAWQGARTPAAAAGLGSDVEAGACRPGADVASAAELAALGAAADAAFSAFLAGRSGSGCGAPKGGFGGSEGSKDLSEEEADKVAAAEAQQGLALGSEASQGSEEDQGSQRTAVAPGAEAQRLLAAVGGPAGAAQLAAALAAALRAALLPGDSGEHRLPAFLGSSSVEAWAAAAVDAFMHADLYTALARVMGAAKGSFGVAAACTLDADRVCLAAWGQPVSLAFCPDFQAVLYSSETSNVMLSLLPGGGAGASSPNGWRRGHCTHRIDLDEGGGEVVQLVLRSPSRTAAAGAGPAAAEGAGDGWVPTPEHPAGAFLRLRVYSLRHGREVVGLAEFAGQGRLVDLRHSPYVSFPTIDLTPGRDAVAADLADIPRLLSAIAADWSDPSSLNRRTAAAFAAALRRIAAGRRSGAHLPGDDTSGQELDVLLTGVEVSLWLAEQFAADLKTLLPGLRVAAISANKVIGVLGTNRGHIPATGFSFCRESAQLDAAIVLAVSHSGQTFPTIHAVRLLEAQMPGRVFVMSGSVDTKMALVLGQRLAPGADSCERCFDTKAGWRSAEPATASAVAVAHSLTELLFYVGVVLCCGGGKGGGSLSPRASLDDGRGSGASAPGGAAGDGAAGGAAAEAPPSPAAAVAPPFGLSLSTQDFLDLRVVRDAFVLKAAPALVGYDAAGAPLAAPAHKQLVAQGRRWALHVLEGPWSWALAAAYIAGTVISRYPLVCGVTGAITAAAGASASLADALAHVALVFDAAIYIWCAILAACLLRLLQRRPLLARWGKRTVVVADVPAVAQCVEAFLSKCFALSYGIASVEVHSANPQDHFVHRFTHRVARGVLLAVGRPDGRLYSQTQSESWILLGLLQAKVIASLGAQPEVVSIGHNPWHNEYTDRHLLLPTTRPTASGSPPCHAMAVLAEALQGLDRKAAANPNSLHAARRHTLAGTVLSKAALEGVQRYRAASLNIKFHGSHCHHSSRDGQGSGSVGGSAKHSSGPAGGHTHEGSTGRLLRKLRGGSDGPKAAGHLPGGGSATHSSGPAGGHTHEGSTGRLLRRLRGGSDGPKAAGHPPGGSAVAELQPDEVEFASRHMRAPTAAELTDTPLSGFGVACTVRGGVMASRPDGVLAFGAEGHVLGEHRLSQSSRKDEVQGVFRRLATLARHRSTLLQGGNADAASSALGALASSMVQVLEDQGVVEALLESRFLSLERMTAFFVLFHAMASRVATAWPLAFDLSRSQSGLRIATTAAPVTASDIERTLAEVEAERILQGAGRRAAVARRWRSAASRALSLRRLGKL